MEVIILGSGSPLPHPDRAGPATLVRAGGKQFLFDCGRGVLMRAAAVKAHAQSLDAVLITHMHSDHTTDLNDVITTRWIMSADSNPLNVIGPVGVEDLCQRTLDALEHDVGYRMSHHADLKAGPQVNARGFESGVVFEQDDVRITAAPTDHSPVHPTLGFRIEHAGHVVAIAGDTIPCAGLDQICQDADIYVQTAIRSDLIQQAPSARMRDVIDYHSDIAQAGETAARCGVKTLVLNHLVPPPPPGKEAEWATDAKARFNGEIRVAHDLLSVSC